MGKSSASKKGSNHTKQNKGESQPRQAPRLTVKVVGQADEKKVRLALELLLTEWVRQARAGQENEDEA